MLMVTYGAGQIYPYFGPNDKKYMSSSIVEAIEMVSKKTVPK